MAAMTEPAAPVADATPDVDTVMSENAELRAALAHYVEGDLDEHLEANIRFTRSGEAVYTAPEPAAEPATEGDGADASEGSHQQTQASAAAPSPSPTTRTAARPRGNAKPPKDPFAIDLKALADGTGDGAFFEAGYEALTSA